MSWITLALLLLLAVLQGCEREATYRDRPVSYWIDASRSPDVQTKQQAIGALISFSQDARAVARLNEIRTETLARREAKWKELCAWLQEPAKTREHRSAITIYIDTMKDREEGIAQYLPTAFPGRWDQMHEILLQRIDQTKGEDRDLYQSLLYVH